MNLSTFLQSDKAEKPHYLLLGQPVEHSLSPVMHNLALKHYGMESRYYAISLQSNELTRLASHLNSDAFLGANITIPYKQLMIDYLEELDYTADKIGAVNTIVKDDLRLKGFNTDVEGFLSPIQKYEEELVDGGAIVFGTGGASRAIVTALERIGMESIKLISRNPGRISSFQNFERVEVLSYDEWPAHSEDAALIVNATPLGMFPHVTQSPVRETEKQFLADKICYDIVYNPAETQFLKMAGEVGAICIGGLKMLIQQGNHSFELWTGKSFPMEMIQTELYEHFE